VMMTKVLDLTMYGKHHIFVIVKSDNKSQLPITRLASLSSWLLDFGKLFLLPTLNPQGPLIGTFSISQTANFCHIKKH
jgi:hypothetical protein